MARIVVPRKPAAPVPPPVVEEEPVQETTSEESAEEPEEEDAGTTEEGAAPEGGKGRKGPVRSHKVRVLETVANLSEKTISLVTFLEQNPDNEAIAEELRTTRDALARALPLIEGAPDNLGMTKKVQAQVDVDDVVEIIPKYRDRFTFLKGAENGKFGVVSLNGRQVGCQAVGTEKTLYIARGQLRKAKKDDAEEAT